MSPAHLFAYGTLMLPQVMAAVAGGVYRGVPALLPDHARYGLRGETYPGLVPEARRATDGILYRDVDAQALQRLDAFEGDWYVRTPVAALVDGEAVAAVTYVLVEAQRHRLHRRRWSLARFEARHLAGFLRDYRGFEELSNPPGEMP